MITKEHIKSLKELLVDEKFNEIEKTAIRNKIWELERNCELTFSYPFIYSDKRNG